MGDKDKSGFSFREFEGGFSWTEKDGKQRSGHALEIDEAVWVVDPVDFEGLDEMLKDLGEPEGIVVLLDRHKRDAGQIAERFKVPIYLPRQLSGIEDEFEVETRFFEDELGQTGFKIIPVLRNRFWREAALYSSETETLVVPESIGSAEFFVTEPETLGVHPVLRFFPPRSAFEGLTVEKVLVGHGESILENADESLHQALRDSRIKIPELAMKTVRKTLESRNKKGTS